jgi:hypothetical protein
MPRREHVGEDAEKAVRILALGALVSLGAVACAHTPVSTPTPAPASVGAAMASTASRDSSGVRTMVVYRESFQAAYGAAALKAFTPEIAASEVGGECQMWHVPNSRAATNVNAWFPNHVKPMFTVELSFDSTGTLWLFNEVRGPLVVSTPPPGSTLAMRDSAHLAMRVGRRFTTIRFDYSKGEAVLRNYGGGKPDDAVVATIADVESLPKYGPIKDRIVSVRKLCGL